ncbi:cysteine--tRNA ligase [Pseudofulvimonas gallinarii]|uniref:Cysteine--tRNA ligase n=1 Tax=Pseudofulvimonas gallinarii TaxID=634155 RepID=A0A4R3LAS0_9GAMM|nr:cysteine--tRNA ligase [Pseudofulvimonas gallinarii]TCS96358.1 cysteinyl-tRNA synthetase [Pseudofulvimonas gallinarii]THD14732.1 cysteine--tRNA ligase [Pseudofulvimonas gallinarii]
MQLHLFNSLSRQLEPFQPLDPQRVTLYICGPTVYNYVHIGNARPPVVFGLLVRLLRRLYPNVVYARNITDVDDKINAASAERGVPISEITDRYAQAYHEDMDRLGADRPDVVPHATDHIGQIIAMCERLIASGHAYAADGHVLFDVTTYPAYGQLSRRSTDEMLAGARVEVAPYKRTPGDFVLWKPSTPDLPGWDSPWGRGRPGWHIECSAMAATHLGETIDIHAGGIDLQFPHHENEIAQSTCAHGGKVFARYWLHNGMLNMGGRKMSKSLGNVTLVHDLLDAYPPEALRYVLMSAHYRQPLDWSEGAVEQAIRTLDRLYGTLRDLADVDAGEAGDPPASILQALCDDLNTPEALAHLAGIAAEARRAGDEATRRARKRELLDAGALLGLLQQTPDEWFKRGATSGDEGEGELAARIDALVAEREAARKSRDFARADELRSTLTDLGVLVEDGADGARWRWNR